MYNISSIKMNQKIFSLFKVKKYTFCGALPRKYLLTTPIFYVNSNPHIGHLYTMIYTDAIANWKKISGNDVIFTTGTDEHGQKIQNSAKTNNMSETDHCDKISKSFSELAAKAEIEYSDFVRTTEKRHKTVVQHFWNELYSKNLIYKDKHEGWYCTSDETFLHPRDIMTDPKNPEKKITNLGHSVEWVEEMNFKFKFHALKDELRNYLSDKTHYKPASLHDSLQFENTNLNDISVSRPKKRISWGIEVPNDSEQTIYVWLDALVNYLTVIGYPFVEKPHMKEFASNMIHVVGKDIVKFHSIYWPAFLIGNKMAPPAKVLVHNHWLKDNKKMSKSLGNIEDPFDLIKQNGINAVRYYFLKEGPEDFDVNFETNELKLSYNDLVQGLINLIMRITSPKILKNNVIQIADWEYDQKDLEYIKNIEEIIQNISKHYENYEIRNAVWNISKAWIACNKYVSENEPWKEKNDSRRNKITYLTLETVRLISILLYPCLPNLSRNIFEYINLGREAFSTQNLKFRTYSKLHEGNFAFIKTDDFLKINIEKRDLVFQNKLN